MTTRKRHTPEEVLRKLTQADRLLAEGKAMADGPANASDSRSSDLANRGGTATSNPSSATSETNASTSTKDRQLLPSSVRPLHHQRHRSGDGTDRQVLLHIALSVEELLPVAMVTLSGEAQPQRTGRRTADRPEMLRTAAQ
jgi:hypothetical protein